MRKSANLNSTEWCDMVFEGKNKAYGAYKLRQTASKRYLFAFGAMLLFMGAVIATPAIVEEVKANTTRSEGVKTTYVTTTIETETQKDEVVIPPEVPEVPMEKFKNMEKFTQIVVVDDDLADAENELKAMEDLTKSKKVIGNFQVDNGSDDKDAIRKELENAHKIMGNESTEGTGTGPIRIAEVMPQFPGGTQEMYAYINKNLRYPATEQEIGTQGRVTVQFVVSKDGSITDVKVIRGISSNCDKEAVKVIKNMPRWIPGKQNGHPVSVYFTLPIVFKLT